MSSCNSRCVDCNSIIAKNERKCWVCGEPVAGAKKFSLLAWLTNSDKPKAAKVAAQRPPDVVTAVADAPQAFAATADTSSNPN